MSNFAKNREKLAYGSLHIKAKRLIVCILKEIKAYVLEGFDKDAEKAWFGNPLLVGSDVSTLLQFLGAYKVEDIPRLEEQFIEDMSSKHSTIAGDRTVQSLPQCTLNEDEERAKGLIDPNLDALDDDYDLFKNTNDHELGNVMTAAPSATSKMESLKKLCRDSYFAFVKYCRTETSDWRAVIMKYPTLELLAEIARWKTNTNLKVVFKYICKKQRYMPIAKYFEIMGWWKDHATTFPKVFSSAVVWLTKPATNALQERAFSRTNWFDANQLMKRQSSLNFEMRIVELLARKVRKEIVNAEKELEEEMKQEAEKSSSKTRSEARQLLHEVSGMRLFEDTIPGNNTAERLVVLRDSLVEYDKEDSLGNELPLSLHVFLPDDADPNASSIDLVEADEVQVIEFFNDDWTEEDAIVEGDNARKESSKEEEEHDENADGDELLMETLLNHVNPINKGATALNDNIDLSGDLLGDTDGEDDADGDAALSHGNTIVTESAAASVSSSLKRKRVGSSQGGDSRKKKAKQTMLMPSKKKTPPPPPKSPRAVATSPKTTTPSKGTHARNNPQPRQTPPCKAKGAKADKKSRDQSE